MERQIQIMTSMHFALSASRSSTVYEAVGRAGMYLTTASITLVALGFISSATSMKDAFYLFAFVLLAGLFLMGIVTFLRVVQTGVEDMRLALSESRIREFYAEAAPGVDKWFDYPVEKANQPRGMGSGSRFQMLLTAGSMIGGVNSAVIGVFVGLAVARFAGASLTWATVARAATSPCRPRCLCAGNTRCSPTLSKVRQTRGLEPMIGNDEGVADRTRRRPSTGEKRCGR